MAFSNSILDKAFIRAGGKCEICRTNLRFNYKGGKNDMSWEAYKIKQGGGTSEDGLDNCKILCADCYKLKKSRMDLKRVRNP
jgi:hypothetical protein